MLHIFVLHRECVGGFRRAMALDFNSQRQHQHFLLSFLCSKRSRWPIMSSAFKTRSHCCVEWFHQKCSSSWISFFPPEWDVEQNVQAAQDSHSQALVMTWTHRYRSLCDCISGLLKPYEGLVWDPNVSFYSKKKLLKYRLADLCLVSKKQEPMTFGITEP